MKIFTLISCLSFLLFLPACNLAQPYYQQDDSTVEPVIAVARPA